ncbi:MAG: signal recognition particle protein [Dehalococcoidia bacterium]|nr:signal recognition particle protein [Dehalococcoidia bacterium]
MFEILSDKLQNVFSRLSGKGRLTEKDVDDALREVRLALLEADVNFRVVREYLTKVRERAIGVDVLQSLTPGQQVIKIVHEEMLELLGGESGLSSSSQPPTIIMLVGLQGAGKTTAASKLALYLRRGGGRPLMVAADVKRPAAIDQLETLGKQIDIPVYSQRGVDALTVVKNSLKAAKDQNASAVILDTAGRLHIDEEMMAEVKTIKEMAKPAECLLVVDAMTGQDAVNAAEAFNKAVGLTGLIMTKMDGDARGGAALSVRHVTGVPIKFIGVGEKPDALEQYHPDRLASRILGMGDVLTLIEKAQAASDEKSMIEMERKVRTATFDLEDFLGQLQQLKKMGSISQLLEMIPGVSRLTKGLPEGAVDDNQIKKVEAIIYSMTPAERHNPDMLDGSRRRRIATGSGTSAQEVNRLLNQFRDMRKMMQQYSKMMTKPGRKGGRGSPFDMFRM